LNSFTNNFKDVAVILNKCQLKKIVKQEIDLMCLAYPVQEKKDCSNWLITIIEHADTSTIYPLTKPYAGDIEKCEKSL